MSTSNWRNRVTERAVNDGSFRARWKQAKFEELCDASLPHARKKLDQHHSFSGERLIEALRFYDGLAISRLLWTVSTESRESQAAWRPFTHWFRMTFGNYVCAKPVNEEATFED